ncbi:putative uncharacterized oxidoreductase YDR541C [Limulus polyphemus]|uniref:Uncharacterized oxidoreductase YDR541C n=1 Tax=Limulus polyphemus TaxID=6850 RepID=A0ABM1C0X1_LIMPO|nr:putative uncharacterized oxidoreductase YDR541C [Limulus polyphemus]
MSEEQPRVLVTGASGYIALHIIRLLLKEGYRVRGTVRSIGNEAKVKHVKEVYPNSRYPIELVEADLSMDDGWIRAVQDCEFVMHVASPFPNIPPKENSDLMVPAVEGTKRVLKACAKAGTVKRVILTSSISAVHGESSVENSQIYDEQDWSNLDSSDLDTYARSKTVAEKVAWEFVEELPTENKFELTVINPGLVIGPVLSNNIGTSVKLIVRLMNMSSPLIPGLNFYICDVRDVALAHIRAMTIPEAAGQRHIVGSGSLWMRDIAYILQKEFSPQGYWVFTLSAPYLVFWLVSFIDQSVNLILSRIGNVYKFSNERMKNVLGIKPKCMEGTILETAYSLIEHGVIPKYDKFQSKKSQNE